MKVVQQLTCLTLGRPSGPAYSTGELLNTPLVYVTFLQHQTFTFTIAAILFYWIRMKVVQQLTCLTLGRPSGPAYSTGELLNTPLHNGTDNGTW